MAPISPNSDTRSSTHLGSLRTTTTNDLLPAPLRIPQRKMDNISDDVEEPGKEVLDNLRETSSSNLHHQPEKQAPQPPPILTMAQRRGTGSKLGSLVSKFEIMDAVNSTEARSSVNPKASVRLKRNLHLEAMDKSLPSPGENSLSSGDPSGISPHQSIAPITPKRSMLPISTRSREVASNSLVVSRPKYSPGTGVLVPVDYQDSESPNGKGTSSSRSGPAPACRDRQRLFEPEESRYCRVVQKKSWVLIIYAACSPSPESTNVTPSPTDTKVHKWPVVGSEELSPQRLPVSKSSREKSLRKGKSSDSPSVRTFETAQSSSSSYENPGHREPEVETTKEYEATPIQVKSTWSQKPSVADLRMSFERISQPSTSIPTTPITPKLRSKPSIQRSPRNSQDVAHPSEVSGYSEALAKQTPIRRSHDASQIQSSPLSRNYLAELKGRKSGSEEPVSLAPLSVNHSPGFLLPRSNRSHQRRTLLSTSNTTGTFVSFESEPIDLELRGSGKDGYRDGPEDPTRVSSKGFLIDESPVAPRLRHYPMSQPKQPGAAGEPHTPANKSLLPKSHTIPRPSSKSEPVSRRSTKVSDLRKLFDRPSIRGSSPMPFMNFRRGRGRTMPPLAAGASAPDLAFFSGDSFATTSTCQRKRAVVVVPPELTTEISVNDFACSFVDDAPRSQSEHEEQQQAPSAKKDSPVKEHIDHFERLDRGSPPGRAAPTKSYDTGSNLRFPFGRGEKSSKQRSAAATAAGGWGTAMWRRISSSFSHSLDGCDNDPQSSSSVHLPAPQSEKQPRHHHHDHDERHRRRSSLLFFGGGGFHHHHNRPSDSTTAAAMAERSTAAYSSYGGGGSSINLNLNLEDAFPSPTTLSKRPSCVNYTRSSLSPPPNPLPLPQQQQQQQRLPMHKSLPLLARRIRLSSSYGAGLDLDVDPDPDLGLDGALQSKVSRRQGDGDGSNQGDKSPDPDALPKAMAKQSAAERWRRKQEEKQMRRAAAKQQQRRRGERGGMQVQVKGQEQGQGREMEKEKGKGKGKGKEKAVEGEEEEAQGRAGEEKEEKEEELGEGEVDDGGSNKDKKKKKESSWGKKTASGFVVRQATDVRKLVNMYREKAAKAASGHSIGSGGGGGGSSSKGNGVGGGSGDRSAV
ncbi:hypothetical protein F4809DRAFT_658525 [Biscogniauxia mediterranea]|nr:hypothetical protein F4809DRAFT_658525 [Biscogniauxia mediterranea]